MNEMNELAQIIMSDCGISTVNNESLFNRILDRLINSSNLATRPDVLCGGCKGIRSDDCPDCNGSGKMPDPRTQAQQNQWISVDEAKSTLKDGNLLYVAFPNGDVSEAVYHWVQGYYPHRITSEKYGNERLEVCTHIMHRKPTQLPPAPEGEKENGS